MLRTYSWLEDVRNPGWARITLPSLAGPRVVRVTCGGVTERQSF